MIRNTYKRIAQYFISRADIDFLTFLAKLDKEEVGLLNTDLLNGDDLEVLKKMCEKEIRNFVDDYEIPEGEPYTRNVSLFEDYSEEDLARLFGDEPEKKLQDFSKEDLEAVFIEIPEQEETCPEITEADLRQVFGEDYDDED